MAFTLLIIAQCAFVATLICVLAVVVAQAAYLQRRMDSARPRGCPDNRGGNQEDTSNNSIRTYMLKVNVLATMALQQKERPFMVVPDQLGSCSRNASSGAYYLDTLKSKPIPAFWLVLRGRSRSAGGNTLLSDIETRRVQYIIVEGCTYVVSADSNASMAARQAVANLVDRDEVFILAQSLASYGASLQAQDAVTNASVRCTPLLVQAPIMASSTANPSTNCVIAKVGTAGRTNQPEVTLHVWGYNGATNSTS